jgi:hypothetical protein
VCPVPVGVHRFIQSCLATTVPLPLEILIKLQGKTVPQNLLPPNLAIAACEAAPASCCGAAERLISFIRSFGGIVARQGRYANTSRISFVGLKPSSS